MYTSGSVSIVAATSTHTNIFTTTAFVLTLDEAGLTRTGSLLTAPGLPVVLPPITIDFANPSTFSFNITGIGSFAASSVTLLASTPFPNASQTYAVDGTFTIGSVFANAGQVITADETWSLNQTASDGHSISIGGTFDAPRNVPEPASLLLVGSGLLALGIRRRKRA